MNEKIKDGVISVWYENGQMCYKGTYNFPYQIIFSHFCYSLKYSDILKLFEYTLKSTYKASTHCSYCRHSISLKFATYKASTVPTVCLQKKIFFYLYSIGLNL